MADGTEKAAAEVREPTLAEKVEKLFAITKEQAGEISLLESRSNELKSKLQTVIGPFDFFDQLPSEPRPAYPGPEAASTRRGRDGFG